MTSASSTVNLDTVWIDQLTVSIVTMSFMLFSNTSYSSFLLYTIWMPHFYIQYLLYVSHGETLVDSCYIQGITTWAQLGHWTPVSCPRTPQHVTRRNWISYPWPYGLWMISTNRAAAFSQKWLTIKEHNWDSAFCRKATLTCDLEEPWHKLLDMWLVNNSSISWSKQQCKLNCCISYYKHKSTVKNIWRTI